MRLSSTLLETFRVRMVIPSCMRVAVSDFSAECLLGMNMLRNLFYGVLEVFLLYMYKC